MTALLALALLLVSGADRAGTTLFPGPVRPGEVLRFVVPGPEQGAPDPHAAVRSRRAPPERIIAKRTVFAAGRLWVETEGGGFVEAARVDRLPAPVEGHLPIGAEGLRAGRILPDDYRPSDLVAVPDSLKAPGYRWRRMSLRADALSAFVRLVEAAARDGLEIRILSAFRSAEYQRNLYAKAVEREPGQNSSAAPGRSEHQLGTAVDVVTPEVPGLSPELEASPAGRWISEHGEGFGVVMTFSRARHEARGVAFEPWHLRWVGDLTEDEEAW